MTSRPESDKTAVLLQAVADAGSADDGREALPAIVTPQQAADHVQVHYETILAEIRDGALPAFKVRRHYRIRRCDLAAYLDPTNDGVQP